MLSIKIGAVALELLTKDKLMREIKFRGWDTIQNKFLEDYKLFCRGKRRGKRRGKLEEQQNERN